MWRNYQLSLSFANLVYLRAWADLIVPSNGIFLRKAIPGFHLYLALVGDVFALSLLIFGVLCLAPKMPGWLRRALPFAALTMAALATSFLIPHLLHFVSGTVLTLSLAILFVLTAVLIVKFPLLAVRLIKAATLAATPCLAVTLIAPLFYLNRPSPLPPNPPLATRLPGSPPVRVMWIIFDEWDLRLSFTDRTPGMILPALDSLASRSFAATRALAVQAGTGTPVRMMGTAESIPTLLYGKIANGFAHGTDRVAFADGELTAFGSGNSIFTRIRSNGWNSAAAGWFLPYCRGFASQLVECYWDERYDQSSSASPAPLQAAADETRMLLETSGLYLFGPSLVTARHFSEYEALLAAAKRYAADPSIALTFIHFNIPHEPYFYNPEIGRYGRSDHPNDLYDDSLTWVDRSVREILSSLGRSGLDSNTAIILSSDHPARFPEQTVPYVPFIVHLPGYEIGIASTQEFSTLRTADLVLAIGHGEIQAPSEIEKFLIRH